MSVDKTHELKSFTADELKAKGSMTIDNVLAMIKEADGQAGGMPILSAVIHIQYIKPGDAPKDSPDSVSLMAGGFDLAGAINLLDRIEENFEGAMPQFQLAYALHRLHKRSKEAAAKSTGDPFLDIMKEALGRKN